MEDIATNLESVPEEVQSETDNFNDLMKGPRAAAIRILSRFERSDSYIDKLLQSELSSEEISTLDKSLLTEIVKGVVRWKLKLDWVLVGFYQGDYLKCLNIVKNAMRVALYQILYLDKIPIHAAVNDSVEYVKRIQGEKTAGVVNGVLRNISRNIENIRYPEKEDEIAYYYSVIYSHPKWMVKRWLERFGDEETEKLLFDNNKKPYIPIRVNLMKTNSKRIQSFFIENNIPFYLSRYLPQTIVIKSPRIEISSLEIFRDGWISVQDTSASLAALLANPKEGDTIIDLCSAPGGKSFFMAELINDNGIIFSVEKYQSKIKFLEEGIKRLDLKSVIPLIGNAVSIDMNEQADIVFADVPCSGLGTLSKKPDIKWKREPEDIVALAEIQRNILSHAATLVKPGGALVYSTCTIEPEENTDNIYWFLQNFPEFKLDPAEKYLPEIVCLDGYMQTFPHIHNTDGAFAARLVKQLN
jgi:16S rRNA (cytosine967-C5)-methyltransferase